MPKKVCPTTPKTYSTPWDLSDSRKICPAVNDFMTDSNPVDFWVRILICTDPMESMRYSAYSKCDLDYRNVLLYTMSLLYYMRILGMDSFIMGRLIWAVDHSDIMQT